jgi:hypothetical protein
MDERTVKLIFSDKNVQASLKNILKVIKKNENVKTKKKINEYIKPNQSCIVDFD